MDDDFYLEPLLTPGVDGGDPVHMTHRPHPEYFNEELSLIWVDGCVFIYQWQDNQVIALHEHNTIRAFDKKGKQHANAARGI